MKKYVCFLVVVFFVFSFLSANLYAAKQDVKEIKVGLLFSLTGPLAPGGGISSYRGVVLAIDAINKRGGVLGKYKIVPVVADAQSSPDIAVREIERLISIEHVPIIFGSFSSGIAVPAAAACEKNKTIWWNTVAVSDEILKDKHYRYAFRPGPYASDYGRMAVSYIYSHISDLGFKDANDIKFASLTEDGPYGSMVRAGNRDGAKRQGTKLVYDDSYSHTTKDMSSIILKLKASGTNVIGHAGYAPDIILFHKQARELGLKVRAVIGEGTMYADNPAMVKALGKQAANYLHNIDHIPLQLRDQKTVSPEIAQLLREFSESALKKYKDPNPAAHYSFSFAATWVMLNDVMPLAIKKYGACTPDNVRKAALEIDIPDGKTVAWYGVKFAPPEHEFAGQNLRAFPVVTQWIDEKQYIVFPASLRTIKPVLPLPAGHPLAQ
jgi:branched-chain amino acid transport system substrate-binding protein